MKLDFLNDDSLNHRNKKETFIARIEILERHADGSHRSFTATRSVPGNMTISELFQWRKDKIHDPVNGEFACREIKLTIDETFSEF